MTEETDDAAEDPVAENQEEEGAYTCSVCGKVVYGFGNLWAHNKEHRGDTLTPTRGMRRNWRIIRPAAVLMLLGLILYALFLLKPSP